MSLPNFATIRQVLTRQTDATATTSTPTKTVTPGSGQPIQALPVKVPTPQNPTPPLANDKLSAPAPLIYSFDYAERFGSDGGNVWNQEGDSGIEIHVPVNLTKHRFYGFFYFSETATGVIIKASVVLLRNNMIVGKLPANYGTGANGSASEPTIFAGVNAGNTFGGGVVGGTNANILPVFLPTAIVAAYLAPANASYDILTPHEFIGSFDTVKFNIDKITNIASLTTMRVFIAVESFA